MFQNFRLWRKEKGTTYNLIFVFELDYFEEVKIKPVTLRQGQGPRVV